MSKLPLNSLANRLILDGLLSEAAAISATEEATKTGASFISYVVSHKLVSQLQLATAIASDFGFPLLDINSFDLELVPTKLISEKLIHQHHVLPLLQKDKILFLAVADPTNQAALDEIKFHTGLVTQLIIVEIDKLSLAIDKLLSAQEVEALGDLSDAILDEVAITSGEEEALDNKNVGKNEDAPIVRYINKVILDAINKRVSDIHFEPFEKNYRIRYRLDGVLQEAASPPINLASRITTRIKIMAQLDISERRVPQDGRFKMVLSKKNSIDFRISTCPTINGEKIVIRILDPNSMMLSTEKLGLDKKEEQIFLKEIERPQGMILVTGPTGSGKTITLYTALNKLNTIDVNISTVEDPVEIYMKGINQVNINLKAGLTFAAALRSFLRQDPDIIMVGEMRDLETAEIGVKAAQTGHLVLSTLHTNSAAETLTRLANMGVPTYNIATSVTLIIAQRLARRLCEHCKKIEEIPKEVLLAEGFKEDELATLKTYEGVGCEFCSDGYKGRVGIFEFLPVSEAISQCIMRAGSSAVNALDLLKIAQSEGMKTLRENGLEKVRQGIISISELNRSVVD